MFSALASPKIAMYLTVALTLAMMATAFNYQRAERFKAQAEQAASLAQTLHNALRAQNKVAEECDKATEELVAIHNAQQERLNAAVTAAKRFRDDLIATREALQLQQENDRAKPECKILLNVDLAAVCPGYASGVRQRAGLSGPGSQSSGTGKN